VRWPPPPPSPAHRDRLPPPAPCTCSACCSTAVPRLRRRRPAPTACPFPAVPRRRPVHRQRGLRSVPQPRQEAAHPGGGGGRAGGRLRGRGGGRRARGRCEAAVGGATSSGSACRGPARLERRLGRLLPQPTGLSPAAAAAAAAAAAGALRACAAGAPLRRRAQGARRPPGPGRLVGAVRLRAGRAGGLARGLQAPLPRCARRAEREAGPLLPPGDRLHSPAPPPGAHAAALPPCCRGAQARARWGGAAAGPCGAAGGQGRGAGGAGGQEALARRRPRRSRCRAGPSRGPCAGHARGVPLSWPGFPGGGCGVVWSCDAAMAAASWGLRCLLFSMRGAEQDGKQCPPPPPIPLVPFAGGDAEGELRAALRAVHAGEGRAGAGLRPAGAVQQRWVPARARAAVASSAPCPPVVYHPAPCRPQGAAGQHCL
jgi:hypothetical protein